MVVNSLLTTVSMTLLAGSSAFGNHETPFSMFQKSMQRTCPYNVSALIEQWDPMAGGLERIRLDRDKSGRVRKVVISPLQFQGVESVDDGEHWKTALPDERLLIDQESPQKRGKQEVEKLKLAQKNYRFSLAGESVTAGRLVFRIIADPKDEQMESRHYYIDCETMYPLKVECVSEGKVRTEFTTLNISYPHDMPKELFDLHDTEGLRLERIVQPKMVPSCKDARKHLGFRAFMPKKLPLGFAVQEMQLDTNPKWHALVIRLSDGLARATVYEYLPESGEQLQNSVSNCSRREVNGVEVMVVSNIASNLREQLLDGFGVATEELLNPFSCPENGPIEKLDLELTGPVWTLANIEHSDRDTAKRKKAVS